MAMRLLYTKYDSSLDIKLSIDWYVHAQKVKWGAATVSIQICDTMHMFTLVWRNAADYVEDKEWREDHESIF
jgi:hypothetical protein